jgi:hypothetical protein
LSVICFSFIIEPQKEKQMTDSIIATERKTNDRQYNSHKKKTNILSLICFSFCGYYIVCHLFFFLWLLYCLSFVFLTVANILSVICFSFCGYFIVTDSIIATERKTNDRQYNSHKKKTNDKQYNSHKKKNK